MAVLVHIAMMMWIPAVLLMFLLLPGRRALLLGAAVAWMFLPVHKYYLGGLPDIDKVSITAIGLLLGAVIFDWRRFIEFRPSWIDLPMLFWCIVSPIGSALANHEFVYDKINLYDGVSHVLDQFVHWGAFYLLGRIYLTDLAALREAAIGLIIGSLIYVPFILYEWRMSPQLHRHVYGYFPHSFLQHMRYGGWRPLVFFPHGLLLVQWLTSSLIAAVWFWHTRTIGKLWRLPMWSVIGILLFMAFLCKTIFVAILLPAGVVVPWLMVKTRSSWPVVAVIAAACLYIGVRSTGIWDGQQMIEAASILGDQKERSMFVRVRAENELSERAMLRPLFGWGRWGRWRIYDRWGIDRTISDGGWIIAMGQQGLVGLVTYFGMFAVPVLAFVRQYPPKVWDHPSVAGAASIASILMMAMIYNIPNSSLNPYLTVVLGGIASLAAVKSVVKQQQPARARRAARRAAQPAGAVAALAKAKS